MNEPFEKLGVAAMSILVGVAAITTLYMFYHALSHVGGGSY